MSLKYKIFGNPQTIDDLISYGKKKCIDHIHVKTGKKLKESTFVLGDNEPNKNSNVQTLVWYEGSLTLSCGNKEIKLDNVYTSKSTYLEEPGDEGINRKILEEAEKEAEYIRSQGLKAIID